MVKVKVKRPWLEVVATYTSAPLWSVCMCRDLLSSHIWYLKITLFYKRLKMIEHQSAK